MALVSFIGNFRLLEFLCLKGLVLIWKRQCGVGDIWNKWNGCFANGIDLGICEKTDFEKFKRNELEKIGIENRIRKTSEFR
jgi:hypothetical protein